MKIIILKNLLKELKENAQYDIHSNELLQRIIKKKITELSATDISDICVEISTIRNRNLISFNDQKILKTTVVGFFGLSVGSHAALTWMMESRAGAIKIMDPDIISGSNLNRLRMGWDTVGKKKISVIKSYLLDISPSVKVYASEDTGDANVKKFFDQTPKINVAIDAIDNMQGKILLRKLSKQYKIPLLSAADVGDNIIIDIERYDRLPMPAMFLGRIPGIEKIDFTILTPIEQKKLIVKLIGFDHNSESLLTSLLSIGKTLSTWPQLGATATISGGIIATVIKKLILGENVVSGRYYVSLDNLLDGTYKNNKRVTIRKDLISKISSNLTQQ